MTPAERWDLDHGDTTLKITYPLTPDSIVWDVGGYHGDWTSTIHDRYLCNVLLFEPSTEHWNACVTRFYANPKITCTNYGLWSRDEEQPFCLNGTRSSLYGPWPNSRVQLKDVMKMFTITPDVDLISLNCEGAEYAILDRVLDQGWMNRFDHVQVQFHDNVPGAAMMRSDIRERMRQTHEERWCYPMIWESWHRK